MPFMLLPCRLAGILHVHIVPQSQRLNSAGLNAAGLENKNAMPTLNLEPEPPPLNPEPLTLNLRPQLLQTKGLGFGPRT